MTLGKQMSGETWDWEYGPVVVSEGRHAGRVGYLDNDAALSDGTLAGIVAFGPPMLVPTEATIPMSALGPALSPLLVRREQELMKLLLRDGSGPLQGESRIDALHELMLVRDELMNRLIEARFAEGGRGSRVFMSHASQDKQFVVALSVDLRSSGHSVWLDEWNILVGESIPTRIGQGIEESDFVVVALSRAAVDSGWVEREWQAKYWDEVASARISVLPILLEDCEVPTLLKGKRYADFREDYGLALNELLLAVGRRGQP